MALIRKIKPGELFNLPYGYAIRNKSQHAVTLLCLTPEELENERQNNDKSNQTQNEANKNEIKRSV